jgi:hypothetical protein
MLAELHRALDLCLILHARLYRPSRAWLRATLPRAATKIAQGWPKLWANFKAIIGIFRQSVAPGQPCTIFVGQARRRRSCAAWSSGRRARPSSEHRRRAASVNIERPRAENRTSRRCAASIHVEPPSSEHRPTTADRGTRERCLAPSVDRANERNTSVPPGRGPQQLRPRRANASWCRASRRHRRYRRATVAHTTSAASLDAMGHFHLVSPDSRIDR